MDLKSIDKRLILDMKKIANTVKSESERTSILKCIDRLDKRLKLDHTKQTELIKYVK